MPIVDSYTLLGPWPHAEAELTVEALAAGMQARGVTRSLVTHATGIFYNTRTGNDLVLALHRQHPPLVPVAVINPLRFPDCLDEVRRCREAGITVFRLCPREHGYPFHGYVGPLREVLGNLDGARLLLVDLAELPAPVLSPDLAELLPCPTAVTVEGEALGTVIQAARHNVNVWVETSRLVEGGAVEAAVRHVGADRVLFGSGAPLRSLGSAVMSVQYAELPDGERAQVFEGNALRVLG